MPKAPSTTWRGCWHRGRSCWASTRAPVLPASRCSPFLERLHERYAGDGLTVRGVSQDSANITRSFARRYGITFPILLEGDEYPISGAFDIMATPTVFLIDRDGTLTYTTMGFLKPGLDAMADAVADALGKPHEPLVTDADTDIPMFVPG